MKITNRNKLLALAHLKTGKSPKQTSEIIQEISYSQALNLNKKLIEAENRNTILELFNLEETALEQLLTNVKQDLIDPATKLDIGQDLIETVSELRTQLNGLDNLDTIMQEAAITLTKRITAEAILCGNIASIVSLADALSSLRSTFFAKGTNIQVNNLNGSEFSEKYLRD